jgi:hypothetical protein
MKHLHTPAARRHAVALAALSAVAAAPALGADWDLSGQVRQEIAAKTTGDQNKANQTGNPWNGVAYSSTGIAQGENLTRPASFSDKAKFNAFTTRLELNLDGRLSETLKATFKLRAQSENVGSIDSVWKDGTAGPLSGQFFRQEFGGTAGGPLAYGSKRNSVDLPAAYVDYNSGPLWIRAGNQQIAWGEAIFFRVADVPNGLDLRGHLLDPAAEEYSDKRRSSIGLRANYRVSDKTDLDAFVQRFSPTLLANGETPYNLIADQFTVQQKAGYDRVKNKLNAGFRARSDVGGFGVQAFAVSRYNPDGVFKWTEATGVGAVPGTPFQAGAGTGVYNAAEWFESASRSRLNGVQGLDAALNLASGSILGSPLSANPAFAGTPLEGLPLLQQVAGVCGATGITLGDFNVGSKAAAGCVLDSFFSPTTGLGNLRGHISREFPRETVVGFGVNHVFEGAPDSLLDQLIGRFEFSYTPKKKFTNPTLGPYLEKGEYQFAFISEKYHKFTSAFPATYFVLQWLHKSQSDLFGRHLSGVNNTPGTTPSGQSGGFNAVALAVQQPSPTLEFRYDFAVLTDLKGGWYAQPGLRWKPSKAIQGDLYANILTSSSKGQQKNFTDGLLHNNEIHARISYQF